jgi:hypothetical protein
MIITFVYLCLLKRLSNKLDLIENIIQDEYLTSNYFTNLALISLDKNSINVLPLACFSCRNTSESSAPRFKKPYRSSYDLEKRQNPIDIYKTKVNCSNFFFFRWMTYYRKYNETNYSCKCLITQNIIYQDNTSSMKLEINRKEKQIRLFKIEHSYATVQIRRKEIDI